MLSASKRNKFIMNSTRDWNAEFQAALEAPEGLEKSLALKSIAYDFVQTSTTYGKVLLPLQILHLERQRTSHSEPIR